MRYFCGTAQVGGLDGDRRLETDVGWIVVMGKEAPDGCLKQFVDFDAGCSFLLGHSDSSFSGDDGQAAEQTYSANYP